VTRFFPSEYGTDIEYSPQSASEKPHQQKLKVRRYMATVKDLEWTYLVTGPYSDLYFGFMPRAEVGTFDVVGKKAVLLGDGRGRVSFTAMAEYYDFYFIRFVLQTDFFLEVLES
jgi:NmrA-like family